MLSRTIQLLATPLERSRHMWRAFHSNLNRSTSVSVFNDVRKPTFDKDCRAVQKKTLRNLASYLMGQQDFCLEE